tara:strand:- start:1689 stop:1844 length:156 start_codon:yes stop_codon:yes gene_type:complete
VPILSEYTGLIDVVNTHVALEYEDAEYEDAEYEDAEYEGVEYEGVEHANSA